MVQNKAIIFAEIPEAYPENGKHLVLKDVGFDLDASPPENGIVVKNLVSSFDPYMRGKMRHPSIPSYTPAYELGKPIPSANIGQVVKSASSHFAEGDIIRHFGPVQEYHSLAGNPVESKDPLRSVEKLDTQGVDLKVYLGALGMPGNTAYSSFYEIGKPKKGETIFVSAASGAVGALVGQLAKHEGLRVIGSVGDDRKLDYIIKELGFDGGFNYKKEKPADALARLAPEGLDIYYENVGGETLQAAFDKMRTFGRIVVCGMISQYNLPPDQQMALARVKEIIFKRLHIQGFIQGDPNFGPKWGDDFKTNMTKWVKEGSFKSKIDTTHGMENAIDGLIGIFKGENFGKAVLQIAEPS